MSGAYSIWRDRKRVKGERYVYGKGRNERNTASEILSVCMHACVNDIAHAILFGLSVLKAGVSQLPRIFLMLFHEQVFHFCINLTPYFTHDKRSSVKVVSKMSFFRCSSVKVEVQWWTAPKRTARTGKASRIRRVIIISRVYGGVVLL